MTAPSTSVVWVALPAGTTPPEALLSVFVSPRLTGPPGATLAAFPPFADWPATIAATTFALEIDGAAAVPATVVSAAPDPALWAALFPATTPVVSRVFDDAGVSRGRAVNTYSQRAVHGLAQNGYVGMHSASPVRLPTRQMTRELMPAFHTDRPGPLARPDGDDVTALERTHRALADDLLAHAAAGTLTDAMEHAHEIARRLVELRPDGAYTELLPATGTDQSAVARLVAFHHVPPAQVGVPPGPAADPVTTDFHAVLTALSDFPLLLRRLGLVVDLQVPLSAVPTSTIDASPAGRLRIVTSGVGSVADVTPWTAYTRDGDELFATAPDPGLTETVGGLIDLGEPDAYDLLQIDVDGSALKGLAAAQTDDSDPDAAQPLPSLRTTGITLARSGQGAVLLQRMQRAAAANAAAFGSGTGPVTLFAPDVLRGLRLDVLDQAQGAWASLHRRVGTYQVGPSSAGAAPIVVTGTDEGTAQPHASHLPDVNGQAAPLRIPEALVRWEGWSLATRRPGATMTDTGPATVDSAPVADGVPLTASFAPEPGSLPRLRYGRQYQVRARAVDIAGNSLTSAEADDLLHSLTQLGRDVPVLPSATTSLTYQRFEPVSAPVLVARERPTEGESITQLVVRSDRDEDAASCGRRLSALDPASGLRYLATNERHVVPAKLAQLEVERFGLLDDLGDDAAYAVSRKEGGRLTDDAVVDVTTGLPVPLPPAPDIDPVTGAVGRRPAVELLGTDTGAWAVHHEEQLTVPYLPDPLNAGVVLCGLPGQPTGTQATVDANGTLVTVPWSLDDASRTEVGSTVAIGFAGSWPLTQPLRMNLAEGDGPPSWDPAARTLTVSLAKGRSAVVRMSSCLPDDALDVLGIWSWVVADRAARGLPAPTPQDSELARRGLVWLLTPYRELTLVHAVQRPLVSPDITALTASRGQGETGAALVADLAVDVPSTSRLDLLATWTDVIDDPTTPAPTSRTTSAHVLHATVPPDDSIGLLGDGVFHLGATTTPAPDPHPRPGPGPHPGPGPDPGPHPMTAAAAPRSRQEFGDTRHHRVIYTATATSAFAEYFPAAIADADRTVTGAAVTVDVPNAARPPAPVVRDAVPIFRWSRPAGSTGPRTRTQVGIRVLLERPWLASGDGEQLAVVLSPTSAGPPPDALRPYVTYWGGDPIWTSAGSTVGPTPDAFGGNAVALQSAEAGAVTVVPCDVAWSAGHELWVCDVPVTIPDGQYLPFVRLAVARYQPLSIAGAELSPIVLVPPVQIMPARTVTVTATADPDTFDVRVDGVSYSSSAMPRPPDLASDADAFLISGIAPVPALVQVSIQQRIPETTDDAGWRPYSRDVPATVRPTSAASGAGMDNAPAGTPLWSGSVTLPPGRTPGVYRVLIAEQQLLLSDVQKLYTWTERIDDPDLPPKTKVPIVEHNRAFYHPGSGRVIFAETIEL